MASELKNLSDFSNNIIPSGLNKKFGIVVAEWNKEITGALLTGAVETLLEYDVVEENIVINNVPGTFELTHGARMMSINHNPDAIIVLGCVIQGETRHFDFICQGVSYGITKLNVEYNTPVIFGVLTTDNQQQAIDRSGGKHGNKGAEAAATALSMAELSYKSVK